MNGVVDAFHGQYYDAPASWKGNTWAGFRIQQLPADMMVYQQILFATRPAFVLQTGVSGGGSLLYFAHVLDMMGAPPETRVIGVELDVLPEARALSHPRIEIVEGSSTASATVARVESLLPPGRRGLVSLDSDHRRDHVLREMEIYQRFVEVGSYLVVEDTNVNGHPVLLAHGPGPEEATQAFFASGERPFVKDDLGARQLFSFHTWLRRVAG